MMLVAPANGYLICNFRLDREHNSYELSPTPVQTEIDGIKEEITVPKYIYSDWTKYYGINTNLNIGDTVNITPSANTNYGYQIVPVIQGDIYKLRCKGGNNFRAWAFTNTNYELVSKSGSEVSVEDVELTAPEDGYLIVNCLLYSTTVSGYSLGKKTWITTVAKFVELDEEIQTIQTKYENQFRFLTCTRNYINYTNRQAITTDINVGSTVDVTPVSTASFIYCIVACSKDDRFEVTGKGGSAYRAWAFTDRNYKLISKSSEDATVNKELLIAPENGYLICNLLLNQEHCIYQLIPTSVQTEIDGINEGTTVPNYIYSDWTKYYYINTNVSTGDTVDTTPVSTVSYAYQIVQVAQGDIYKLRCRGGNNSRAWAFTDENYKLVSKSGSEVAVEDVELIVPEDGYLIVNALLSSTIGYSLGKKTWITTVAKFADVDEEIEALQNGANAVNNELDAINYHRPLVKFSIDHELKDVSALVSLIDYTNLDDMLFQFYDLFDGLVTDYPDYVTKYDAALYDGLSMTYPRYANGIESGDLEYLETEAYKTYLYKFSSINLGAGNARNCKKKKLFIVCGTHGSEEASPFNAYIFAKMLCEASDENYFKLRDAFDIYIVPCLNGYGALHTTTNPRVNANGVNINRNYPVENW